MHYTKIINIMPIIAIFAVEKAFFEYNGTTTTKDRKSGISYSIGDIVTIEVKSAEIALGTVDFSLCKERNDI